MDLRIAYTQPNGLVAIVIPVPGARLTNEQGIPENDEAFARRVAASDVPAGVPWRLISATDVPTSRIFRDAWRDPGAGSVQIDVAKAQQILLARVRSERNRQLDDSDKEKVRLDDIGTPAQREALAAKRQALRDLPAAIKRQIETISDPQRLETFAVKWPSGATTTIVDMRSCA